MLKAVRWLAGLQIVQGLIELGWGVLAVAALAFKLAMPGGRTETPPEFAFALSVVLALVGALRIWTGILCWQVRGRAIGIVALVLGLASVMMCCPTSPILFIFGLIVYLNGDVAQAFRRRAEGASAADALSDRDDPDTIAAVFDADEPGPGLLRERRELDTAIVEALVDVLPNDWNEAFVELSRSKIDAALQVVVRDRDGAREIVPDTHLLDVLGALDEFTQVSGEYIETATLRVWEDGRWRFEWEGA